MLPPHIKRLVEGKYAIVSRKFDSMYYNVKFENSPFEVKVEVYKLEEVPIVAPQGLSGLSMTSPENITERRILEFAQFYQNEVYINSLDISWPRYVWGVNIKPWSGHYALELQTWSDWIPKPDGDKKYRYWGFEGLESKAAYFSADRILAIGNRTQKVQGFYGSETGGIPEEQLASKVAKIRETALKKRKKSRKAIYEKIFIIRVQLDGIEPPVYRDIRVSGKLSLRTMSDKIIQPALGWSRSYHCYYFMDLTDGSLYGYTEGTVDNTFLYAHGNAFISDEIARIGDLVEKVGDTLEYVYDLGARWCHTITVLEVEVPICNDDAVPVPAITKHCSIVSGCGACPAEDGNGTDSQHVIIYSMGYDQFTSTMVMDTIYVGESANEVYMRSISPGGCLACPSHVDFKQKHQDIADSMIGRGIRDPSTRQDLFDWHYFDLAEANGRLESALRTRISTGSGGDWCECCRIDQWRPERDSTKLSLCANCGNANNLKYCSACKVVHYCSPECQKNNWSSHKADCKRYQNER